VFTEIGGPPFAHVLPGALYTPAVTQLPSTQPVPEPQVFPQLPQFALSTLWSTHPPPHGFSPTRHVVEQPIPAQTWPEGHVTPHAPQFFGLALVGVQTPLQVRL
jgi:hypothetical protein